MTRKASSDAPERGAALVTVIMMVAMMSALAISVVETARFGLQRTANSEHMDEAHWYLLGAEAYAAGLIDKAAQRADDAANLVADWIDHPLVLPLDGGGSMQITVADGSNCFNLNSVVMPGEGGRLIADPDGVARFALFLEVSGLENSQLLAAALADWIDTDAAPLPGGAEAPAYEDGQPHPPNALLTDRSDLARVAGFRPDVIARIAPLVCARPAAGANPINIETIRPDQARLLAAIAGRGLSVSEAEQLISARPADGWGSTDAFLADSRISRLELSEGTKALLVRRSNWYVVAMTVRLDGISENSLALVTAGAGHARVVRRVFGAGDRERLL